jgi:hypothetical protein
LIKKSLIGISFALIVAGCGKGGGGGSQGDVLAVVNGEAIPMIDYYKTMERKPRITALVNPATLTVDSQNGRVMPQVTLVQAQPSLAIQALQDCLVNELIRQVAKDEGVYPKPADINSEIKLQEERNPNFIKDASKTGLSLEQIKSEIALSLARLNLQAKGVTVTDQEVTQYIKDTPASFTEPAKASLLYIEVADEATKGLVDKELKEGQTFPVVAQHYSLQPNGKETGFRFQTENIKDMPAALQKLVAETREFSATKWVQDGASKHWVKFYVSRKVKATPITINNYIRQMVRRELMRTKGSRANDPDKRVADKLKTAKIEVKVKHLAESWDEIFKQITKAQEQKPAPTPTQ